VVEGFSAHPFNIGGGTENWWVALVLSFWILLQMLRFL
jgi:hypothetical protein